MKFVLTQSLFHDAFGNFFSKNLKIVWDQVTLPQTGFPPIGTIHYLGVKIHEN
jgi:hypothetical protein